MEFSCTSIGCCSSAVYGGAVGSHLSPTPSRVCKETLQVAPLEVTVQFLLQTLPVTLLLAKLTGTSVQKLWLCLVVQFSFL